ncbi:sensor histidine kinase [Chitinophaga solisilvae]|uniref:Histidine kinase n=1 Tax=Chitinophaga solisilvae TaxID=1233460 RepID=A0A3S1CQT4_9BACT|nr:histidine kinase [Chitinophaga solisilvae]NSL85780.1 histidine kinase [Chitinophaga solisilvae]
MNKKLIPALYHVLFWMIYAIFWTTYSMLYYGTPLGGAAFLTLLWMIGQGSSLYIIAYLLIPRLLASRRYVVLALSMLVVLVLGAAFITLTTLPVIRHLMPAFPLKAWQMGPSILLTNFYMTFLFLAIKWGRDKILQQKRQQQLEKEQTAHELKFLKSQLNPHFLFNAINSIYILIKKDPDYAAAMLARFADMLRYQLYECNSSHISIDKEIGYLNHYLEVEQLRKGNTVAVQYHVAPEVRHFHIAPLLLIPFVENAFKHVSVFPDKSNHVIINLTYDNHIFEFSAVNTMDINNGYTHGQAPGGIGLENVKRRLELLYNGQHRLHITNDGQLFSVLLRINIP